MHSSTSSVELSDVECRARKSYNSYHNRAFYKDAVLRFLGGGLTRVFWKLIRYEQIGEEPDQAPGLQRVGKQNKLPWNERMEIFKPWSLNSGPPPPPPQARGKERRVTIAAPPDTSGGGSCMSPSPSSKFQLHVRGTGSLQIASRAATSFRLG